MAWLVKRGPFYYIRYSLGKRDGKRKVSTGTGNFQLAKEKLREFEDAWARGDSSLPTKTPITTADKGPWFFHSPWGKRWEPDNFSAHLRTTNLRKKLPVWWSNLIFRHTFGSQLAMRGESLYKIATLMGNSPLICQRHYAALIPEALGDCVEFAAKRPAPQTALSVAG